MDINNNKRVFGVYQNEADAQRAVEELLKIGYTSDQISVLRKSGETIDVDGVETATEAGLKGGAATGAAIGGVGGLLAGLGLLVIPGIGPILAAGPIAAAFAGAVTGGTIGGTIGTLGGAMMDAGVDETDARYLDERFHAGDIIVYVEADTDRFDRVSDTLGYRRWDTNYNANAAEFDESRRRDVYTSSDEYRAKEDFTSRPVNINPEYTDSDLRHDNWDLNEELPPRDAGVRDVRTPQDSAPRPAQGAAAPVTSGYADSDLHHDNMDLEVDPIDPMRNTDPTDPNYRAGATRNDPNTYGTHVNSGDAMRTGNPGDPLRDNLDRAEDRVQDAVTDTKHNVEKTAEKIERRVDNAGEPLEEAQNWAGDRVSDIKHEAGKIIDKAKNRLDD